MKRMLLAMALAAALIAGQVPLYLVLRLALAEEAHAAKLAEPISKAEQKRIKHLEQHGWQEH